MSNNTFIFPTTHRLDREVTEGGLSLRDLFASLAMQAIIQKSELEEAPIDDGSEVERRVARGAYSYADAMLAEREAASWA